MLRDKKALLLDMNDTFMFGADRFGEQEDFSRYYRRIGGRLPTGDLHRIIRSSHAYLDARYPDERYRHAFPSVAQAIDQVLDRDLPEAEKQHIVNTFAFHELGHIPPAFVEALQRLKTRFLLAAVIDIWSPKNAWLETFDETGVGELFAATSFSSDHGMVKPSPRPFEHVVDRLNLPKRACLVIGDSARRDLGGALAAGIDCVLVGGSKDPRAVGHYSTLLDFCRDALETPRGG